MTEQYEQHVRRQSLAYTLAYADFEANLTPEERKIAGSAAVPELEGHISYGVSPIGDASDAEVASYCPDMALECDTLVERLAEMLEDMGERPLEVAEKLVKFIGALVDREAAKRSANGLQRVAATFLYTSNAKLSAAGLAFAVGLDAMNGFGTMAEYAASIGVSRQAVSKVAKQFQEELDLPPSPHMRSDAVCETYSEVQKTNHWRSKTCKKRMRLFK
ncbi:MAG: hypothetical protein WCO60_19745 [Verrucomicrobiota bacterium]